MIYKRMQHNNYDLWSDSAYDNYDYETEIKREYKELGYNPRKIIPIGKEIDNEKWLKN